jgi:hypothetical protein
MMKIFYHHFCFFQFRRHHPSHCSVHTASEKMCYYEWM